MYRIPSRIVLFIPDILIFLKGLTAMKLLLDVPIEGLAKYLVKYGYDVFTATEKKVIPDDKLLRYAKENDCVLIIEDKKASKKAEELGIRIVKVDMEMIAEQVHVELLKLWINNANDCKPEYMYKHACLEN